MSRRPSGKGDNGSGNTSQQFPAIVRGHVLAAEMAAREMGGLSLMEAPPFANSWPGPTRSAPSARALRWLERFIDERISPLAEVALAPSALAELRHGRRNAGLRR